MPNRGPSQKSKFAALNVEKTVHHDHIDDTLEDEDRIITMSENLFITGDTLTELIRKLDERFALTMAKEFGTEYPITVLGTKGVWSTLQYGRMEDGDGNPATEAAILEFEAGKIRLWDAHYEWEIIHLQTWPVIPEDFHEQKLPLQWQDG